MTRLKTLRSIIDSWRCCPAVVMLPVMLALAGAVCTSAHAATQPAGLGYVNIPVLRLSDPNLLGEGVTIAAICRSLTYLDGRPQNDYRLNTEHSCLWQSRVNFVDGYPDQVGISQHSTAIGAILVGSDQAGHYPATGDFHYEGIAPAAKLEVYEFWRFVRDHVFEGRKLDAGVLTMSLGITFDDWWTHGIEMLADRDGTIIVASAGNGDNACEPVLYPAAGANVIAVGVVNSAAQDGAVTGAEGFSLPYPTSSSTGPTAWGISKPDLVAPGNFLVPDANSVGNYLLSGDFSSFAAPVVSGIAALLVERAGGSEELHQALAAKGGNCVIRAILMNSAQKLPFWHKGNADVDDDHTVPLDMTQGAGLVDAAGAMEQLLAGRGTAGQVKSAGWDNNIIERSGLFENAYTFEIDPAEQYIAVTLVWNRHYQQQYPFAPIPSAESNLRLELWAVDPNLNSPKNDYMLDLSDSYVDNVEHIFCKADPNYSHYEVVVTCTGPADGQQVSGQQTERYGVAWDLRPAKWQDNRWWNDLNADGVIDYLDSLIYSIIKDRSSILQDSSAVMDLLKLSGQRFELLSDNWAQWKKFFDFGSEQDPTQAIR